MSERKSVKSHIAGNTLISILFFMLAVALIGKPAIDFYDAWIDQKATTETNERLDAINKAVSNYVAANGRYPCPAPMTAQFDTAAFGKEVNNCASASAGLTISQGQDDLTVAAGAVPVRTLGLPDDAIYDGYNHRYIYTITEAFTSKAPNEPNLDTTKAAIRLVDDAGTVATREQGNIIFAVTSLGDDMAGAYNRNGIRTVDCTDTAARSFENCNMDATLVNTINKSHVQNNQKFTQITRFKSQELICKESGEPPPAKVAFLLDTSGSMDSITTCPPGYTAPCNRMDAAHWALRRVVGARQSLALKDDELKTDFTGFTGMDASPLIDSEKPILSAEDNIEEQLKSMCPKGNTPLDEHVWALAERIGMGESVDRPNVIMVVSDGYNNGKGKNTADKTTLQIAQEINIKYEGRIVVNIIDLGNNPDLEAVAQASNASAPAEKRGKYYNTANPEDIVASVRPAIGACNTPDYEEPDDERYCPVKK